MSAPDAPVYSWEEDDGACPYCGDDGFVELWFHPELWGEDVCADENDLIPCPHCPAGRALL